MPENEDPGGGAGDGGGDASDDGDVANGGDDGVDPRGSASNGTGLGYRRLEGQLTAFAAEFETLAAEADGEAAWAEHGRQLIADAKTALEAGKIEQGWNYLHGARRLGIHGLEAAGGQEALRGEARELLVEARNAPLSWRADAVRERLAKPDGSLRTDLTASDLRSARKSLHEGYQSMHLKRRHLQAQFRSLRIWAAVSVAAFLVVTVVALSWPPLPTPVVDLAGNNTSEFAVIDLSADAGGGDGGGRADPVGVLVYVVLAGMLGASLFGLRSLRRQPASTSTPQYLTGAQTSAARVVVGAGSALAVFFFVGSGLVTLGTGSGLVGGPFLIALGFVAGYSQRLVHSTVESVASTDETGGDGDGSS